MSDPKKLKIVEEINSLQESSPVKVIIVFDLVG
jgi:hypothetical protein